MTTPTPGPNPLRTPLLLPLAVVAAAAVASAAVPTPISGPAPLAGQEVLSPEEFFGHSMGADRELAHWDDLAAYYRHLDEASPRLLLREMGPSTWGNPFLVLFVSSPENLDRLDELQRMNAVLSDPRGASEAEIRQAQTEGVAVIAQSFGLHAREVSHSQTAAELAYDLVTRSDPQMLEILDNTLSILFPSLNPDGTAMFAEWYREWLGTEYEGSPTPWLFHPYTGHNNNRDAYMQNTVESRYAGQVMLREWVPQAFVDHHEMGGDNARFSIPPYSEPIRPDADPLIWREIAWYGAHMAYRLEEEGHAGVVSSAIFPGWGHFGFHWLTNYHNIAGMLTESARTGRLATPVYIHPDQLQGGGRQFETYEPHVVFPNPWPGGWWRLRDNVEQQRVSALATLEIAAQNRELVLRNAYLKASRQIQRGERAEPISHGPEGPVAGFIIPAAQHDPLTARKLVHRLLLQGIDVRQVQEDFVHEGIAYDAESYWVTMAQPKRGVVRWLLGRTFYPDNHHTRTRDGVPFTSFLATHTLAEFMGVRVDRAGSHLELPMTRVQWEMDGRGDVMVPPGQVRAGSRGYRIDARLNDGFKAVNLLFDEGISVRRVHDPGTSGLRFGDFLVGPDVPEEVLEQVARRTGVDFAPLDAPAAGESQVERRRVGLYQRFYEGNMDEGWTRLILEEFHFPYDTLFDAAITAENLDANYDVVILPADRLEMMLGPDPDPHGWGVNFPPEYRSGFGEEGAAALETFVRNGGTLVTFAEAGDLPIKKFPLPVRNVLEDLPATDFYAPGATLHVNVDGTHPAAWGMPTNALATFGLRVADNQAYQVVPHDHSERVDRVITFPDRDIMESGWLIGEEHLAGKAAMLTVRYGEGTVVLIGFRPQHRGQTHGTLKVIFNSLLGE
jgi:hypothetical protein